MRLFPMLHVPLVMLTQAACVPEGPPMSDPIPVAETCAADSLRGLIGRPASDLDKMKFKQPFRVIRDGAPVTMDYSPERVNIEVDAAGMIWRVSCG